MAMAQTEDTVQIRLPFGDDTTCPGLQLRFTAEHTNDTMAVTYRWFHNGIFTGVTLDTFYTTAPVNGDSVWAKIYFTNSLGFADSAMSNIIYVYRSSAIMPRVVSAITGGANPDCPGRSITFTALPVNGGTAPLYQWYVDNVVVVGATSESYTNVFNDGDTVSVMMVSNSVCASPTDTAYSNVTGVIRDSLTAGISIAALSNPICAGEPNSFTATVTTAGAGPMIYWFLNGSYVVGAAGAVYPTDTLRNGDIVHAMLVATDACVINDTTIATSISMTVIPNLDPAATLTLTNGANPGCLDSAITFTAAVTGAGTTPDLLWLVNDTVVASGTNVHTQTYTTGQLLTFRVRPTDGGCYSADSFTTPAILMIRDSTPVAPLVSLIDNMLVANSAGTYKWYFNGVIVPGASGQTYHPPAMGFYYAIKDTGNCQSLPSNVIYISLLDVKEISGSGVKLYPNPTSGVVNMEWGGNVTATLSLTNVIGQEVWQNEVKGVNRYSADFSKMPAGTYMLTVRAADGSVSTNKLTISK